MEIIAFLLVAAALMAFISGSSYDRDRMPPPPTHYRRRPTVIYEEDEYYDDDYYRRWYRRNRAQAGYNAITHTLMFLVVLALALLFAQDGCNKQESQVNRPIEKRY